MDDINKSIGELRNLESQAQYMQKQLDIINRNIQELETAKSTLNEMKNADEEILVPIGAGIYIKTRVSNKETGLANIGAGAIVEKTVLELLADIEKKKKEFMELGSRIDSQLTEIAEKIGKKEGEVREIAKRQGINV